MELGETFEETAKRELKEEMGVEINDLAFFELFSGSELYHEYPNGDKVYSVVAVYIANDFKGKVTPDHYEIGKIKFYTLEELPRNITKVSKVILNHYINKKRISG